MTTDPHDEHGEILRRALHAEAESVNPAGDGLEHIRARIADGSGRRSGLGRLGPAGFGFGFDRFTVGWARPVLAVAAAVLIAGLGVTAPQTIDLIQQVGSDGPTGGQHDTIAGDHTGAAGNPEFPDPSSPDGSLSGTPSASESPTASSSPGLSSCTIAPPPGSPTATATPGAEPDEEPTAVPCPGGTPTRTPTPPPTQTPTPPPPPEEPTQAPTSPPASEQPARSVEQGTGAAGTAP